MSYILRLLVAVFWIIALLVWCAIASIALVMWLPFKLVALGRKAW